LIFLDTSAIYAMADRGDPRHQQAKERFQALLETGEEVLTHNYVLIEAMALIQHRLGVVAALKFADSASAFEIEWVDRVRHAAAVRRLVAARRRHVSLVDHVSFIVMRSRGVDTALAFDSDFETEGFRLL